MKKKKYSLFGNQNAKKNVQRLKIEVEVWGIEVEETTPNRGWYKFEYSLRVNGGKKKLGERDGSWSSQTLKHFKQVLGRGYAARMVVEHCF